MRCNDVTGRAALSLLTVLALSACTSPLVSSWMAPDAKPFEVRGEKVAAVVMLADESTRRAAEDALARELTGHGAQGIPMYTLLPYAKPGDEGKARAAAEQAGIVGVVVMRPVRVDKEISASYSGSAYGGFWGGYYGHGWGSPWGSGSGGEIRTDTIVTIETLVYGLQENKLLWGGQSRSTNPRNVNRVIEDTAKKVAKELVRLKLLPAS